MSRDTIYDALDRFTHTLANGAPSLDLAVAKADLDTAYRSHVTSLHLSETLAAS